MHVRDVESIPTIAVGIMMDTMKSKTKSRLGNVFDCGLKSSLVKETDDSENSECSLLEPGLRRLPRDT